MESIRVASQRYQELGLSVIPTQPDKKPYLKWEEFQKRRAEPEEIREWFKKWPDANIAIITGKISGLDVIDCDSAQGETRLFEKIEDRSFDPPQARSPRGTHFYIQTTGQGNRAAFIEGVDYRGEGGYIIAPPSRGPNGKTYAWVQGHSILERPAPAAPASLLNILNSYSYIGHEVTPDSMPIQCDSKRLQVTSSDFKLFTQGRRDNDLFHVANHLVKGGMPEEEIQEILRLIASNLCNPPFPEKELQAKIKSALDRAGKREINFAQEVRDFVVTSNGFFVTSDVFNRLQVTSRQEKKNVVLSLLRLQKDGVIEKHGQKDGCYRKIETDLQPVNFMTAPTDEFPIEWPLGVHTHCKLYPKNIVLVAGSKGAGKTSFLLNTVKLNRHQHEIIYLNSEMGDTEFRTRLELFEDVPLNDWRFKAFHRSSGFSDLITPEKKIFIVDYLEVTKDFWQVSEFITQIHNKLKDGICIIALQKAEGRDTGRGGDFSKEKSRLYLALDYLPEKKVNALKIVDAKAWRGDRNPRGMCRHYHLVQGSKYYPKTEWV